MINAVQLLLLLPLIGAYLPLSVVDFIRGMSVSLFDVEFLNLSENPETRDSVSGISFDQTDPYLYLIGLESGSSIINILAVAGLFILIPIMHIPVWILHAYLKKKEVENWLSRVTHKFFHTLTFGVYIRFLFEVYIYLLLTSTSEIINFQDKNAIRRVSLSLAIAIFIF